MPSPLSVGSDGSFCPWVVHKNRYWAPWYSVTLWGLGEGRGPRAPHKVRILVCKHLPQVRAKCKYLKGQEGAACRWGFWERLALEASKGPVTGRRQDPEQMYLASKESVLQSTRGHMLQI